MQNKFYGKVLSSKIYYNSPVMQWKLIQNNRFNVGKNNPNFRNKYFKCSQIRIVWLSLNLIFFLTKKDTIPRNIRLAMPQVVLKLIFFVFLPTWFS